MQALLARFEMNNPVHTCTLTNGTYMVGDYMTDKYMSTGVCKVKEHV